MSECSENIICPYCKEKQTQEMLCELVTYWGDTGSKKIQCEHCEKDFYVKEQVERNFETTTIEEAEKSE